MQGTWLLRRGDRGWSRFAPWKLLTTSDAEDVRLRRRPPAPAKLGTQPRMRSDKTAPRRTGASARAPAAKPKSSRHRCRLSIGASPRSWRWSGALPGFDSIEFLPNRGPHTKVNKKRGDLA